MQPSDAIELRTNLSNSLQCTTEKTDMAINVSFPIYVIGFMSFISWFLFIFYGGIGLAALPLDFIYAFCNKPRKLTKIEMEKEKQTLCAEASELRRMGEEVKKVEPEAMKKTCKD
jgi:LMBR1 domain-containing protein 1